LNSRRSTIAWIASIALLAIFAGLSWLNLELSPEAGAQKFEIFGFQVFPIISALLLLQVAALLASLLTPKMVSRVISGLLSPIMLAHGLFVVVGLQSSLQSAIEAQITEITGVAGFASQAEFVAFAGDTYLWVGYLLAVSLNLAILLSKSLSKAAHSEARPTKEALVDEQDLWETQK
jgi:hypothetical protein